MKTPKSKCYVVQFLNLIFIIVFLNLQWGAPYKRVISFFLLNLSKVYVFQTPVNQAVRVWKARNCLRLSGIVTTCLSYILILEHFTSRMIDCRWAWRPTSVNLTDFEMQEFQRQKKGWILKYHIILQCLSDLNDLSHVFYCLNRLNRPK